MSLMIRGGTVVTADETKRADVYCEGGTVKAVGEGLEAPADAEIVDAGGALVMPGGIDPHTHMEVPFMGTVTTDDFFTGPAAALAGGTTMIIDFVIPDPETRPMEAWRDWMQRAAKAPSDYSFHVAITNWNEKIEEDMGVLARENGVNSFKHFMAYKGAIMLDDEKLLASFARCQELGALCTVHAENGELVWHLQRQLLAKGITGPEGHPQSRPPEVEGEAANRAIRIAQVLNAPIYIVHVSCKEALEAVTRARLEGQRVFGRMPGAASRDRRVGLLPGRRASCAGLCDEPALPPQGASGGALARAPVRQPADHGDRPLRLLRASEGHGQGRLHQDPERHQRHRGPHVGALAPRRRQRAAHPNEFVALSSANAARIFNIYPRKGTIQPGADADIVVWDPKATRTISVETHHQNVDFNIFEGMEVQGVAATTISRGRKVWDGSTLNVEEGTGQYVDRPTFPPVFAAVARMQAIKTARRVERAGA